MAIVLLGENIKRLVFILNAPGRGGSKIHFSFFSLFFFFFLARSTDGIRSQMCPACSVLNVGEDKDVRKSRMPFCFFACGGFH